MGDRLLTLPISSLAMFSPSTSAILLLIFVFAGGAFLTVFVEVWLVRHLATGDAWWAWIPIFATGCVFGVVLHGLRGPHQRLPSVFEVALGAAIACSWILLRLGWVSWCDERLFRSISITPQSPPVDARVARFSGHAHAESCLETMEETHPVRYVPLRRPARPSTTWFEDWSHHAEPDFCASAYLIVPMRSVLLRIGGSTRPANIRTAVVLAMDEDMMPSLVYSFTTHSKAARTLEALRRAGAKGADSGRRLARYGLPPWAVR